jgi:YihY family inner membrane protein
MEKVQKVIAFAYKVYNQYRKYVPAYASAALSFYLLILIIPATSILAWLSNLFHIDLNLLETILGEYLQPEYSKIIVGVLNRSSVSISSIVILGFSIYAVSRGVGNIYLISKKMFKVPGEEEEGLVGYYGYVFKVTILLLFTMTVVIFLLVSGPFSKIFHFFTGIAILQYVIMFWLLVLFFICIYMIVPRATIDVHDAYAGAIVASSGILIFYIFFKIYMHFANYRNVYGPLASLVLLLFVFNWSSEVFYIGMYVTHNLYLRRAKHEKSNPNH